MTVQKNDLFTSDARPVLSLDQTFTSNGGSQLYRKFGKRALDVFLVLLAAPIIVPFVLVTAFFVMLDGGNPFYVQDRVGRNGRIFKMVKLRSMVQNADSKLEAFLEADPEARREWDLNQKLRNDPRITRFGHALRKTSIDELPQLWNVLIGDMSLVGPRPMMPDQKKMYPGETYYDLRPGVSGYWQISERSKSTFAARAGFDTAYDKEMSLGTDLRVLVCTVLVVLRGTGC